MNETDAQTKENQKFLLQNHKQLLLGVIRRFPTDAAKETLDEFEKMIKDAKLAIESRAPKNG